MSGYFTNGEAERVLAELRDLRRDVGALQGSAPRIPVRDEDPPVESPLTLWMLQDGRLRGRRGSDGEIVEYAFSTHLHDDRYTKIVAPVDPSQGGGSTTQPGAPGDYVPSTRVYESGPDWTACYWKGGAGIYANAGGRLYYGMYTSSTGELKSMVHFPALAASLSPGPAGTRIAEVAVRITNLHTVANTGSVLRLGLHNAAGAPGAFSESEWVPFEVPVGKPSVNQWYQLPAWVGDRFRDGSAQGITLDQRSTAKSLYGYAQPDIVMRVVYVK